MSAPEETDNQQLAKATIDSNRVADILDYLSACYGDLSGRAHTAIGRDPYLTDKGKYNHRNWRENHCAWPDEAEALARTLAEDAAQGDVYVCPYLMWSGNRTPGGVVARILIHADVDTGCVETEKISAIGGFAIKSGSAGNAHVYVPLSEPIPASQHTVLERALGKHFKADAKISSNDVLRPPGTLNYKPTVFTPGAPPAAVEWLVRPHD